MQRIEEKIQQISAAALEQAERERKELLGEAASMRETQIAAFEEEFIAGLFLAIQKETTLIRRQSVRDKARAELEARRELLLRRGELTKSVFAAARTKLFAYAGTPAYREKLLEDIAAWNGRCRSDSTTVYLRETDLDLEDGIARALGETCRVEVDPAIKIGGFKLLDRSQGMLSDETLDQKLEDQRPRFLESCGMKIS